MSSQSFQKRGIPVGVSPHPEDPNFEYKSHHCTAKNEKTPYRCKASAMKGSDKCKRHGGRRPNMTHGRTSRYGPPPQLRDRIEELQKGRKHLDLPHIGAHIYALLEQAYGKIPEKQAPSGTQIKELVSILAQLQKTATEYHRHVLDAARVDLEEAKVYFSRGLESVLSYVPKKSRAEAERAFFAAVGLEGDEASGESVTDSPTSIH